MNECKSNPNFSWKVKMHLGLAGAWFLLAIVNAYFVDIRISLFMVGLFATHLCLHFRFKHRVEFSQLEARVQRLDNSGDTL